MVNISGLDNDEREAVFDGARIYTCDRCQTRFVDLNARPTEIHYRTADSQVSEVIGYCADCV